ncbi:hypothetical protein BC833DRAFT_618361 [Globomyces pollinis-pini]|nr:hypothetical protein BC833DRAFT_618361 [Globomyces pollinis-pini]
MQGILSLLVLTSPILTIKLFCSQDWRPVCAELNNLQKTFGNECLAINEGYNVIDFNHPCKDQFCSSVFDPVCGLKAGVEHTYENECKLKVDGAELKWKGECHNLKTSKASSIFGVYT